MPDEVLSQNPTISLQGQGGEEITELKNLTIPLRIGGTFSKPSYSVDLERLLDTGFAGAEERGFDFGKDYRARNLLAQALIERSRLERGDARRPARDAGLSWSVARVPGTRRHRRLKPWPRPTPGSPAAALSSCPRAVERCDSRTSAAR